MFKLKYQFKSVFNLIQRLWNSGVGMQLRDYVEELKNPKIEKVNSGNS